MRSIFFYALVLLFVCSCSSRIPEPTSYQYSQQKTMQVSSHWEVLAADLANRINNQLIVTDNIYKTVFVKETCGDESIACKPHETSSFNEAFRDLLITNLFGYGVSTKSRPDENAIEVHYKVQVVNHDTNRIRSPDRANTSLISNGHYEVIITTSMINNDRYLFRTSNIYYINDKDFYHYQENMPQTKTILLSSKKSPEQTDNRRILTTTPVAIPIIESSTNSVDKADM